ncbi:hypothetical protein [Runella sp.]|uniref:hypothetical protein n=1 Tax=Runella sp. TaxID=1960881 RepID=UPI003D110AFE
MPTDKVIIKLYSVEYAALFGHLHKISTHTGQLGLNSTVSHMVLYDLFWRKGHTIECNAKSKKSKPRSITLKPVEAKALYDELRPHSYTDVLLCQIFGHLDRALLNLGFNNTLMY